MVSGMVSGLQWEMASGMYLECNSIDQACLFRQDPRCLITSSFLLFSVLFEMDVLAVLEEC
jgi:hypothetical protein